MALGLHDLIAQKQAVEAGGSFEVTALGDTIVCRRLEAARVMSRADEYDLNKSAEVLAFNIWLIYTSCMDLHSQELLDAYGITGEPEGIVPVLWRQNVAAIEATAAQILARYSGTDDLKN